MKLVSKAVVLSAAAGVAVVGGAGVAAAGGGGGAHAVGGAKNSPGVLSGNLVQIPVHVPVNVCGNTVEFVGLLSPAFGNRCINR
ncbi:chaplin [Streptomyces sp. NPDC053427]|uniref:chaplin n=1 Tax=Streptomyces sp. NPDC053427 TaxID=3365701 RepID=UPI0037CF691A